MPNPLAVDIADALLGKKTLVGGQPSKSISMEEAFSPRIHPVVAGTLLSFYCEGFTKMANVADGYGGSYSVCAEAQSNDCGYNASFVKAVRSMRND